MWFPWYFFGAVTEKQQPLLSRMIRTELQGIPERLPSPFQHFRPLCLHFAVGGRGSGSSQHFHRDAFNILLAGKKKWWLWPPARAALSRVHPARLSGREEFHRAMEVLQEPGDILYVPREWGHAVLNVAEYTVSISVEFDLEGTEEVEALRAHARHMAGSTAAGKWIP